MSKFKTLAASLALALSLGAAAAHAGAPARAQGLNTAIAAADDSLKALEASTSSIFERHNIQTNPRTCGGSTVPALTPKDGYSTVCVDGILRFVNLKDTVTLEVKVSEKADGKKNKAVEFTANTAVGMPIAYSALTTAPYVSAVSRSPDGKWVAHMEALETGSLLYLDTQRIDDHQLLVQFDISNKEVLDVKPVTLAKDAPSLDGVGTRDSRYASFVRVPLGKSVELEQGGVTVELKAVLSQDDIKQN